MGEPTAIDPEAFSGPLSERLIHKIWKVRLGAYEEIAKLFKEALDLNDKVFYEYGNYFSFQ
jgi:hypothetical protein